MEQYTIAGRTLCLLSLLGSLTDCMGKLRIAGPLERSLHKEEIGKEHRMPVTTPNNDDQWP